MDSADEAKALEKEAKLKEGLAGLDGLAIAYSGGVDSSYLAAVAHEVFGDRMLLILGDSPSLPRRELAEAQALAQAHGWRLEVVETDEFTDPAFLVNDPNRCYYCKAIRFDALAALAAERGLDSLAHGDNADDALDASRVGARAAAERSVIAPLHDAGLTKAEVRVLSRRRGLPTADKASFACLATRIPTGTPLDVEDLKRVEAAEDLLASLGFEQYRARHHGDLCRIEVLPDEVERAASRAVRERLVTELRGLGYRFEG